MLHVVRRLSFGAFLPQFREQLVNDRIGDLVDAHRLGIEKELFRLFGLPRFDERLVATFTGMRFVRHGDYLEFSRTFAADSFATSNGVCFVVIADVSRWIRYRGYHAPKDNRKSYSGADMELPL